jgi:hypothetical protein
MSVREALGTIALSLLMAVLFIVGSCRSAAAQSETATHVALGSYLTASYFDASITAYCHGQGTCRETNPILRPIVEQRGVVTAMTVKGAMHAGIAAWLLKAHKDHPRRVFWITVGLTAAQVAVDVQNVRVTR